MLKNYVLFMLICAIFAGLSAGGIELNDDDVTITPKGYGAFEFGQIGHGYYRKGSSMFSIPIDHVTQERCFSNIGFVANYRDFFSVELLGEGMIAFSTPQIGSEPTTMQTRHFFYIKSSNATISLGDPESFGGKLQVGYFPYKYNSDVRNLGEYLFRSIPYPLVIFADFDYAQADLLGLRLNGVFQNDFLTISDDLILHSETVAHPVQNWSISDIGSITLFDFATIGGGISFHHFFSAYQGQNIAGSAEEMLYLKNLSEDEKAGLALIDYEAVKLMGRVAFDPKTILGGLDMLGINDLVSLLGKNDLRLYGEVNVLGLKNYPDYHDKITDRMLWTFGFNFPGFKLIDLINLEFEYCENNSAFSDADYYATTPSLTAVDIGNGPDGSPLKRSPWRWSLYLKKSLFNEHFSVITQFARDHKKLNFYYFTKAQMSFRETLPTEKDWWWTLKTEYKF